ncbi:serine/threonine-protein kinase [Streptomyces sp. NBC_00091]|uniref:serine/threonine-protein kinase n=1 Tax=Streptomyces sp. NBC_00091 TaxID=2975648 RepID=UPI00224CC615|nr:serine/threonine-protein kinase [Streptomyces sp. NBC_00091]MCX5379760.1 serine/threonine protein kinase [Streptomyces sp. NBC_00091]
MSAQLPGVHPAHQPLSADDPDEIGGYRLRARLGSGGMGVVYLAHTPGGRPIALKAVRADFAGDPEFRRRFAQEVASARRIHGLFTAQVVDSGVDAPTPWLATAYVPGPSLQQVVRRHGPLPTRTVLLLVAGIAEALQAIHRAGVVHRDLKPANVLIAEDGPRVIDFGIARAVDATALTGVGLRIGTAAFMAPEQAMGLDVTAATDVFALGALAAYVAGGAPPFGAGAESAALYRVVHEQPDLTRVPRDLHDLLSWCLAKGPGDRPTPTDLISAAHAHPAVDHRPEFTDGWLPHQVSREISGQAEQSTPTHDQLTLTAPATPSAHPAGGVRSDPPPRRARRRGRRPPVTALIAAAALVAAGGAAYYAAPPAYDVDDPGEQPAPAAAFAAGYANAELTSPDPTYEFDLKAGKVVPADTATWYLARSQTGFVTPEDSDAFIAAGDELSPADCVRGVETQPVTTIAFSGLSGERPFCVRSADRKDVAIVRLIEAAAGGGSVTVEVSHHRRAG